MIAETVQQLRDAASQAHRRGDIEEAVVLFEKIVSMYPETPEAVDAVFYLSSIGKGKSRRPARRSTAAPHSTGASKERSS
ncbi:MAG TPA: hypothetical protein VFX89_19210 [Gammaproteobacteria bacterium]|nr:hypothetical protein [Gammaproteobacteria bacterium]